MTSRLYIKRSSVSKGSPAHRTTPSTGSRGKTPGRTDGRVNHHCQSPRGSYWPEADPGATRRDLVVDHEFGNPAEPGKGRPTDPRSRQTPIVMPAESPNAVLHVGNLAILPQNA